MPDSSAIDTALVTALAADAALHTLMPDGVHFDQAPAGATRFVIVSLIDATDEGMFGGRAFEEAVYLVKAVALSTTAGNVRAAAARIDALLEDGALTIPGFVLMRLQRDGRVRTTEVDEQNPDIRWEHRGGRYQLQAQPL